VSAASSNFHLVYGSPCIDAGNNGYAPSGLDPDGNLRILDGDFDSTATVDMGAYEYNAALADADGDGLTDQTEVDSEGMLDPTHYNSAGEGADYVRRDVTSDPGSYGLYTSNSIMDLSMGYLMLQTSNGYLRLRLQLEQCSNLVENVWSNAGDAVVWSNLVPEGKAFYRVRGE